VLFRMTRSPANIAPRLLPAKHPRLLPRSKCHFWGWGGGPTAPFAFVKCIPLGAYSVLIPRYFDVWGWGRFLWLDCRAANIALRLPPAKRSVTIT
jgi:hypothetical protein